MNPLNNNRISTIKPVNNLYTAILAVAFAAVLATAIFVAFKCYVQYDTIINIP